MTCPSCDRVHRPDQPCLWGVLLVCGGRNFADRDLLFRQLDRAACRVVVSAVRHGAARGADALAGEWARDRGLVEEPMPADWDTHGRAAGPIRNGEMLARDPRPVVCVAFRGSAGTQNMVSRCEAAQVPVWRVGW